MCNIVYDNAVKKDVGRIDGPVRKRIKKAIEVKLSDNPHLYGEHLKHELRNYWKLRVGDYRVVYKMEQDKVVVFGIIHRREVYEAMIKRKMY